MPWIHVRRCALRLVLLLAALPALADGGETLLLRQPALSRDALAFVHGGDLWIQPRTGGVPPRRLTTQGSVSAPHFSPDGQLLAYSATYDGNTDVYVVPAAGGEPRRLTYHPGPDVALGWTPDG
ncbi:MAG: PD40 domain-containing protein, partial [Proteobacteria bacterium]|nr:PD40 domain-containing protein [Pseudomonadota bacterium]